MCINPHNLKIVPSLVPTFLFTEPFKPTGRFHVVSDKCTFQEEWTRLGLVHYKQEQSVLRDDLLILVSSWDLLTVKHRIRSALYFKIHRPLIKPTDLKTLKASALLHTHSFYLHSHEDCSFFDEEFHSREIPKHHVDDEEEERATPAMKPEIYLIITFPGG